MRGTRDPIRLRAPRRFIACIRVNNQDFFVPFGTADYFSSFHLMFGRPEWDLILFALPVYLAINRQPTLVGPYGTRMIRIRRTQTCFSRAKETVQCLQWLLCNGVFVEVCLNFFPVYNFCKIVHVFSPPVLVLQVICMLPHVAHHKRHGAPTG